MWSLGYMIIRLIVSELRATGPLWALASEQQGGDGYSVDPHPQAPFSAGLWARVSEEAEVTPSQPFSRQVFSPSQQAEAGVSGFPKEAGIY